MHRAFGGDRPAPPAEGYVSISLTAPEASQRLLRECATSRMVHVTRLLAIEGIDVNVKDARGRPALVVAATHGVDAVVTAFIEAGPRSTRRRRTARARHSRPPPSDMPTL